LIKVHKHGIHFSNQRGSCKMREFRILGCLVLVLLAGALLSQSVPQLINFQGRLTDSAGQPIDGTREMRFRLLDADTLSATVLWSETHSSVQVDKGIYHVILGSVNPLPPAALGSSTAYLEVRVQGEILRPRSLLTSVPFAHKAATVSDGAIRAGSIGEDCALGEVLAKTTLGWKCITPGGSYSWTWVSGSDGTNQYGVYGTKGTPDPANNPGGRYGSVSWTDASGNLWLFGGYGYAASGSVDHLNDLWRWDGTNWTWISGSDGTNQNGIYGKKGTPDPANVPGARNIAVSWTDSSFNFWLFGGYGYDASGGQGYPNDLWRWDGSEWTWMSGSDVINQYGVYGTKGTPDQANVPGSRCVAVSWKDSSGSLWLFGGSGFAASGSGYLNDLWRFK
jgi:hypothetical protein